MASTITQDKQVHVFWRGESGAVIHWAKPAPPSPDTTVASANWKKDALNVDATVKSIELLPGSQLRVVGTSSATRPLLRASQDPGATLASPRFPSLESILLYVDKAKDGHSYLIHKVKSTWTASCLTGSAAVAAFAKNKDHRLTAWVWEGRLHWALPLQDFSVAHCALPLPLAAAIDPSQLNWCFTPTGGKNALVGAPQALILENTVNLFVRTAAGHVYEAILSREALARVGARGQASPLPGVQVIDVFAQTQQNQGAFSSAKPMKADPFAISRPSRSGEKTTIHLFYLGEDNRLRELLKREDKAWKPVSLRHYVKDLDEISPHQSPLVCFLGELHVFYLSKKSGRLMEIFWKGSHSKWKKIAVSDRAVLKAKIVTLYSIATAGSPHIVAQAKDGTLYDITWHKEWFAEGLQTDLPPPEDLTADDEVPPPPTSPNAASAAAAAAQPAPPPAPGPPPPGLFGVKLKPLNEIKAKPTVITLPMKENASLSGQKKLRLCIVSDTHNHIDRIPMPEADILLHAGDFTVHGTVPELEKFRDWLRTVPIKHKLVIQGNHDYDLEFVKKVLKDDCYLLADNLVSVEGINFFGAIWGSKFKIPPQTDILLTHVPPTGYGDIIWNGESRGSKSLTAVIKALRIPISISGHNHEGYGVTYDENTTYINAATCVGGAKSVARRQAIICDYYPDLKHLYTGKPQQ